MVIDYQGRCRIIINYVVSTINTYYNYQGIRAISDVNYKLHIYLYINFNFNKMNTFYDIILFKYKII